MKFDGDMLTIKDDTGHISIPVETHGGFYYFPKKYNRGLCLAIDETTIYFCRDASVKSTTRLTAKSLEQAKRALITRVLLNIVDSITR